MIFFKWGLFRLIQDNGRAGIRCTVGGFVDGPHGTLAGTQGAKAFDNGCVDRVTQ